MKELEVAIEAAKAAGEILRREYQKSHAAQHKIDRSPVSGVDLAAERTIIETIHKYFPDHTIFSEEAGSSSEKSKYLWVVDPLDGSTNFLQSLGHFCSSIALVRDSQPLLAAVYIPLTDELFSAETNGKATCNGKEITPSRVQNLKLASLGYSRSPETADRHAKIYMTLISHIRTQRLLGSTVIHACYTACGRFDAFVSNDCKLYDVIAGAIIAAASGAKVTDFTGNPWHSDFSNGRSTSDILISNPHIHADLVAALQAA